MWTTLPSHPLPAMRYLLSGRFSAHDESANALNAPLAYEFSLLLARSALSLAYIAIWHARASGAKPPRFFIPDYFCNTSLGPLRELGVEICFYPITSKLEPNYRACRELAKARRPDFFLLVHYFGYGANTGNAKQFCDEYQSVLIEDSAHLLEPLKLPEPRGTFLLASPHKLLPIPDGAILYFSPNGLAPSKIDPAVGRLHWVNMAQSKLARTKWTLFKDFKWLLQTFVGGRLPSLNLDPALDQSLPIDASLLRPSARVEQMLPHYAQEAQVIRELRMRNFARWEEYREMKGFRPAFLGVAQRLVSPYLYPVLATSADDLRALEDLRRRGVPVSTWPDLAPEVLQDSGTHLEAIALRKSIFFLPIHQSITPSEIARRVETPPVPSPARRCSIAWDTVDRNAWINLMSRATKSNILQDWDYGVTKESCENWRVRRGVVSIGDRPVAIFQSLTKRVGLFSIIRINRGPLLLAELDESELALVYKTVGALGNILRGSILLLAPPLEESILSFHVMQATGFRLSRSREWISSWIDLSQGEEELRAGLEKKWRASLKKAASGDVKIRKNIEEEQLNTFVSRLTDFQMERNFLGIPPHFLKQLLTLACRAQSAFVLEARTDKPPIAAICVLQHGNSATYLAGYSTEEGRAAQANYLLLWEALFLLKARGIKWFDLGGCDPLSTPEIASFKSGLGGRSYRLVGEYFKAW